MIASGICTQGDAGELQQRNKQAYGCSLSLMRRAHILGQLQLARSNHKERAHKNSSQNRASFILSRQKRSTTGIGKQLGKEISLFAQSTQQHKLIPFVRLQPVMNELKPFGRHPSEASDFDSEA